MTRVFLSRPAAVFLLAAAVLATGAARQPRGLGNISFPTSGPPNAQRAFVRGVALLHNFEYDDAIESFREAQRQSATFAMAYWGEAMCYWQPLWRNEDAAKARATLSRLAATRDLRAAKAPTAREKGYLDAVERLFGDGDQPSRLRAYSDRMTALSQEFPDDDEAALFSALARLATIPEGARNPPISLETGAVASAVLKKNPQHPGAAHYALHAYDDGEHNRLGLEAARIYAKIAPASSHALHMPSHVFLPLGMWDEAAASDEASFAASVAWVKRTGRTSVQQDFHSLSWLHYAYLQQGRFAKARAAADLVQRALETTTSMRHSDAAHHVDSEIGRGYGAMSLKHELASMRARDVVESRDWSRMKGQTTFGNIDELFALGLSSVALSDPARAQTALDHLRQARSSPERDAGEIAAIMADQLEGVMQFAGGHRTAGLAALARATDAEARRPHPVARPYPIKPAAELYGEILLAADEAAAAMIQFKAALARTPRRAASLLGLAAAASVAGARQDAAAAARDFLEVWRRADPGRSEIADAKRWLEAVSR